MANRFWVGGTGTWTTSSTTVWSATSGGPSGASVPTAADSVFFDQAGTFTVTLTGALLCLDITVSAGTYTFTSTGSINISGSMSLLAGTVWSATGILTFNATTTGKTVTTNGVIMSGNITFNGVGGEWTLGSALATSALRTVTLTNGTLDLNGFTLTTGFFSSSNNNTRAIAFGTGNITVIGPGGTLWTTATTTGLATSGTQVVNVSYTGAVNTTVSSGSPTQANSISFNFTAGTYALTHSPGAKRDLSFAGFAGTVSNTGQTIYGNLTLAAAATYTAGASTWFFSSTSTGKTITTNAETINFPVNFIGIGGGWVLQDAMTMGTGLLTHTNGTLDLNGFTLTVGTAYTTAAGTKNLTFNGGTLVCPAATTTAFNNAQPANFTTTAGTGTGTISMTGSGSRTFVGGGSTFNCTLYLSNTGSGTTITGSNTFNDITNLPGISSAIFTAGTTNTFNNFNLLGTVGTPLAIDSSTLATHTLSKASGTVSRDYLSITNSIATGGAAWYAGANSTDNGGNTGWIFTAAPSTNTGAFFSIL